jgi:type I site-specific restriction endonuclease
MALSEEVTRKQLIDPAIKAINWAEEQIKREEQTAA